MVANFAQQVEFTPRGILAFDDDPSITGKYVGEFQGSINLDRIEITVNDISEEEIIMMDPTIETYKEVPGGLNISYDNVNTNNKLDGIDTFIIYGGEYGDVIIITYIPTGEYSGIDTLS